MKIDKKKYDVLFGISLLLVVIISLYKVRLGYAFKDEQYYLSTAFRFIKGDALIVDGWGSVQLSSCLLIPLVKLFVLVAGSNNGIILFFRGLYIVMQIIVLIVSYCCIGKENKRVALGVCFIYGMYCPSQLMALSYTTMGLAFLFLLVSINYRKKTGIVYVFNGLLLAGLVLCNPLCIVLYFMYVIYCIYKKIRGKLTKSDIKDFIYLHSGILILLIYFLILLFSHTSLGEIIENIPYNLMEDSSHTKNVIDFLYPFYSFIRANCVYVVCFVLTIAGGALFKKKKKEFVTGFSIATMVEVIYLVINISQYGDNYIAIPLTFLGFVCFIFTQGKNWRRFFLGGAVPIIYALCLNYGSNQGILTMANACLISSSFSLFLMRDFYQGEKITYKYIVTIILLVCIVQIGAEAYLRISGVYWEGKVGYQQLNHKIAQGPLKGLMTTKEKKERYDNLISEIKDLRLTEKDSILFYSSDIFGYDITDATYATYSAWIGDFGDVYVEKLEKYYKVHPERKPNIIFVSPDIIEQYYSGEEYWKKICDRSGYQLVPLKYGSYALKK